MKELLTLGSVRALSGRTATMLVALACAIFVLSAAPAPASGSHSLSKSFSTCAYTIAHKNTSRAEASTVGNSNCYLASVRLQYSYGGNAVWSPTTTFYNAVWYLSAPIPSQTIKSTHQVQHYPSYQWSGTSTLN